MSGHVLYVISANGRLYALARADGAVKWSRADVSFPTPLAGHAPAVAGGRVFTTAPDTSVRAFDAKTGAPIWHRTPQMGASDLALANGVVYVGTTDAELNAFNAATGKKLLSGPPGPPSRRGTGTRSSIGAPWSWV